MADNLLDLMNNFFANQKTTTPTPEGKPTPDADCNNLCQKKGYASGRSSSTACGAGEIFVSGPTTATYDCCCKQKSNAPCTGGYKPTTSPSGMVAPCKSGDVIKIFDGVKWCCPPGKDIPGTCKSDTDCATYCGGNPGACSGGKCHCLGEVTGGCNSDADCPPGYACSGETAPTGVAGLVTSGTKKCVKVGECSEGKGMDYPGCPCGKTYVTKTGVCEPGYVLEAKTTNTTGWEGYVPGAKGRCDCIKYCLAVGCDAKCENCQGGGGGTNPGDWGVSWPTFQWPTDIQGLYKNLEDRINYLLNYPSGYTPAEKNAMLNYMTKGIKGQQGPELQAVADRFGRAGLLGSGPQMMQEQAVRRSVQQNIADAQAQVAIQDIQKRVSDLATTTGLAGSLAQIPISGYKDIEEYNASRRGEGRADLAMMLNFLSNMKAGTGQNNSAIMQAILNYFLQQQQAGGGGTSSDWLYWLPYLFQ